MKWITGTSLMRLQSAPLSNHQNPFAPAILPECSLWGCSVIFSMFMTFFYYLILFTMHLFFCLYQFSSVYAIILNLLTRQFPNTHLHHLTYSSSPLFHIYSHLPFHYHFLQVTIDIIRSINTENTIDVSIPLYRCQHASSLSWNTLESKVRTSVSTVLCSTLRYLSEYISSSGRGFQNLTEIEVKGK